MEEGKVWDPAPPGLRGFKLGREVILSRAVAGRRGCGGFEEESSSGRGPHSGGPAVPRPPLLPEPSSLLARGEGRLTPRR